jgi:hypothetical protein
VTGQVVLPPIRRKVLGDQLYARLKALPGPTPVTVYRGEVDDHPPLALDAAGQPDPSGRVAPYVVLFDGTGTPDLEPDLAGRNEDLRWSPQITVAAGWSPDCTQLVDLVCAPGSTAGPRCSRAPRPAGWSRRLDSTPGRLEQTGP